MCAATALAACSGHSAPSPPSAIAAPTIQIDYSYGSASNPLRLGPPPPGTVATVTEQDARAEITKTADTWFGNVNVHGELVRFGYGSARGRAADSGGDTHAFRHRRPAWVAVYRFATAGVPISSCPVLPRTKAGYRAVQLPQRKVARLVVLVDAQTGYLATWNNLRNDCPQLVPIATATEGRIRGRFLAVGGPPGASADPQLGTVILRNAEHRVATKVGPNGWFSMIAPVGRYRLLGFTPQFTINGHRGECNAVHPVVVRAKSQRRANVYCQRL